MAGSGYQAMSDMTPDERIEALEKRVDVLSRRLEVVSKHSKHRGQLLKGMRSQVYAKIASTNGVVANIRKDLDKLNIRLTRLTPKGADRVLRTYEHIDSWTLPMQQKINTKTEISKYLDAANVPAHKYREFDRAWVWAIDNWSDKKWQEQGNQTLDSLLGILITEHRAWLDMSGRTNT